MFLFELKFVMGFTKNTGFTVFSRGGGGGGDLHISHDALHMKYITGIKIVRSRDPSV